MTASAPDFERRACAYDRHAAVQREAADWLAEWLPQDIAGPALELGAGTGLFTRHLVGRTRELTATDVSLAMLAVGRARWPQARWELSDAAHPPAGAACRWFFSSSLLQWLPQPAATLRRWSEAGAPDARLLSGWFIKGTMAGLLETCADVAPFPWRDDREWSAILGEAGWVVLRQEVRTFSLRARNSAALLRELHELGAVVPRRFPPGRLRGVLKAHDERHRGSPGVQTPFVYLRVEAVKQ